MDCRSFENLQEQTTEELEAILAYCLQETHYADYQHTILEILGILEDRCVPDLNSEAALWVREQLLRYVPKKDCT